MFETYIMMSLFDSEKRKKILIIILVPVIFLLVLLMSAADMSTTAGTAASPLSAKVEKWRPMVTQYCTKYNIPEYCPCINAS